MPWYFILLASVGYFLGAVVTTVAFLRVTTDRTAFLAALFFVVTVPLYGLWRLYVYLVNEAHVVMYEQVPHWWETHGVLFRSSPGHRPGPEQQVEPIRAPARVPIPVVAPSLFDEIEDEEEEPPTPVPPVGVGERRGSGV